MQKYFTIEEIAKKLNCEFTGDGTTAIRGVAPLQTAAQGQASFLDNSKYRKFLPTTRASLVVLKPEFVAACPTNTLKTPNPYLLYAKLAKLFWHLPDAGTGIHATAVVSRAADVASSAIIGPYTVIEAGVKIGENVIIGAGSYVGHNTTIADHTRLWSNVTVYYGVKIGSHCSIHSGVVIGADGFGIAQSPQGWEKVPQMGGVIIGHQVEIGANTTIDRGALENTVIGDGVKLDNLIQVGHNVKIGAHTAIAAGTAIAGSTTVGRGCMIAGKVGIAGHLTIADEVVITAMSGVANSIEEPGYYSGIPVQSTLTWRKSIVHYRNLHEIEKRIRKLEKQMLNKEEMI